MCAKTRRSVLLRMSLSVNRRCLGCDILPVVESTTHGELPISSFAVKQWMPLKFFRPSVSAVASLPKSSALVRLRAIPTA